MHLFHFCLIKLTRNMLNTNHYGILYKGFDICVILALDIIIMVIQGGDGWRE